MTWFSKVIEKKLLHTVDYIIYSVPGTYVVGERLGVKVASGKPGA